MTRVKSVKFLSRIFSKTAEDFLAKGDRFFQSERFFEARNVYEEGAAFLEKTGSNQNNSRAEEFVTKISKANRALAEKNINEAEYAISCGAINKAIESLELAKALTEDVVLREKADILLGSLVEKTNDTRKLAISKPGCNSCGSGNSNEQPDFQQQDTGLSPLDYYDLLSRQLPDKMYSRYANLGENFACAYLASSKDDHVRALSMLEEWYEGTSGDIYFYEKGMILHRLGNTPESEEYLLKAIKENNDNPLPHFGLALLLIEDERLEEARVLLDTIIEQDILIEQAILLRGDISLRIGDIDGAIGYYVKLLATPSARTAAEKLHGVLMNCGRQHEAAAVFKQYLKGCGGH